MVVNPYFPPNCDSRTLIPDVEVRSRFPLDIIAQRAIYVDISEEMLDQRVQLLTQYCEFKITNRSKGKWTLQRGSLWNALFTFTLRKLPTTVVLEMISATQLSIWLRCSSALTVSTPGDAKRISRELDELERYLLQVE